MAPINFAFAALASLMDRSSSIMELVFQSNLVMAVVSCVVAVVFLVHMRAAMTILHILSHPQPCRSLIYFQPSPINIVREITLLQQSEKLHWNCYHELPTAVLLENNGRTVVMRISCSPGCVPYLSGGSLPGSYFYVETIFKWGTAEHSIDSCNYDLEMQVLHATNLSNASYEYVTVAYLFALTDEKNHFLAQIVDNLWVIRHAGSVVELPPFDLGLWLRCFSQNYYTYSGTYANGNIVLSSQWIICPHILSISPDQLAKFLALNDLDGRLIVRNAREKQPLGDRFVALNC